jgi:Putative peptidoglycan binding domain/D-alanyl-D-alanine carboxypeptidase
VNPAAVSTNGYLPLSELASIRGGFLRHDAAAAFNAMDRASVERYNVPLFPASPVSSYRSYAQQVLVWNLYRAGKAPPTAVPGTSAHGWGIAIDLATPQMRGVVDAIGARFGWSKTWSDAPAEWWHVTYRADAGEPPPEEVPHTVPILCPEDEGDGPAVLQQALRAAGAGDLIVDGHFGPATERAVTEVQAREGLAVDGIAGEQTIAALGLTADQLE